MLKLFPVLSFLLLAIACGQREQQPSTNSTTNHFNMQPSVFNAADATAPHPEKKPKELTAPSGDKRMDEYYWLNERKNPEVTTYLNAENEYAEKVMAPVKDLKEQLFEERVKYWKDRISNILISPFNNNNWFKVE